MKTMNLEEFEQAYRSGIFIGPYTYEQYLEDAKRD